MTPDEQHMIQDLFQRLSAQGRVAKDPQADRVITDAVRSNPDAAYMLVQTALVYEHQMNEQEQRLRELEDQIAQLQRGSAPQSSGGSFLGGRLGSGRGAVPDVGSRPQAASPWSSTPAQQSSYNQAPQQPQQRGMFGGSAPAQAAPAAGGGFLRSALTTAAGVAGGMMVANSLSNMFGGGSANAATPHADNAALADANATQDELQDAQYQEPEASSDLGGWDDVET
jgi:uncharacterized protein